MSLTVQTIVNATCADMRNVLDPVANFALVASWVDRINKDAMISSVYSPQLVVTTTLNTVSGQRSYQPGPFLGAPLINPSDITTGTPVAIRRILSVYDTTRDRMLFPLERSTSPVSQLNTQEANPGQAGSPQTKYGPGLISAMSFQSSQPEYYKFYFAGAVVPVLILYPTPKQVITLSVSAESQIGTISNPGDFVGVNQIPMPDEAFPMVVAGVNWLACMFLKRAEEAQIWFQTYENLKRGNTLI